MFCLFDPLLSPHSYPDGIDSGVILDSSESVQVKNSTLCHYDSIALQDWTNEKKNFFEMAVGLSKGVSCKAKTRKTEKELFS
jgi:hypothetical protein